MNYFYAALRFMWWLLCYFRFKRIGIGSYFYRMVKVTPKFISCGRGVYVYKNGRIEGVSKYGSKEYKPLIIIGDNVSIQQNVHITSAKSIILEKNIAIGANVTITDIHHSYEDVFTPIEFQDLQVKEVYIGCDCKLYNNSVILPGTFIGKHCTVGANSVVSGKFPDYCVIVGAPAKIVKRYNFETQNWEKTESDGSYKILK